MNAVDAVIAEVADWPYRFELVDIDDTWIDRRYQRDLKPILSSFNPALIGTLTLSLRSRNTKHYSIIDGQRRRDLVKGEGVGHVPAVVFYDLTVEQEAELFALFQKERRGITQYERFRAELTAQHPTALAINKMVRDEGFELVGMDDKDMRHIAAVRAVERIYARDPEQLRRTLQLLRKTWDGVDGGSRERMISGVAMFLHETPDVDEQRFVKRLKNVMPSALDVRATQLRDSRGLTGKSMKFMAEVIRTQYRRTR